MSDIALFIHSKCCGEHWVVGKDHLLHCCGCGEPARSIQVSFEGIPDPVSRCCSGGFELVVFENGSFGLACEQCQEFADNVTVTGPNLVGAACARCLTEMKKQEQN